MSLYRLVQELVGKESRYWSGETFRISKRALETIQEVAEAYLVDLFNGKYIQALNGIGRIITNVDLDAVRLMLHAKRVTVKAEDLKLAREIRYDPPCRLFEKKEERRSSMSLDNAMRLPNNTRL